MKHQRGAAMLMTLTFLAILTISVTATLSWFHATHRYTRGSEARLVCAHIAEAGIEKAIAELRVGNLSYAGESDTVIGDGTFSVGVLGNGDRGSYTIESTGRLPRGADMVTVRLRCDIELSPSRDVTSLQWREEMQ